MKVEMFVQQVQDMHGRLSELYQGANGSVHLQSNLLLPVAFKELGTASEVLQVASEELLQKTEELAAERAQLEAERQRYQDLFNFMPNAYLVTDAQGKIQEANFAAVTLLNVEQSFLVGKLLVSFIPPQERQEFRTKLNRLHSGDRVQEWTLRLQRRQGELFDASVSVSPVRDLQGNLLNLRWMVEDVTERKKAQSVFTDDSHDFYQNRPKYFYSKGELIWLDPSMFWIVRRGIVKLSTLSDTGEEVLLGLASSFMPFGSSLTSLPTYQAIALSETVELVTISFSELTDSPSLTQALLPQITKRLRQTEFFLAISGKRHVKERLYHLLLFLKQEIGQRVEQGTRLNIRFTHQDLADACCTTRVTITRLLNKLHQQGKIRFDSKHHLIVNDIKSA